MSLHTWWSVWGEVVRKLVALVASFASMAGLLFVFLPPTEELPSWAVMLLIVATSGFVVLLTLELTERSSRRVYARTDTEGVRRYMHDWIRYGGRVVIWTRDLSWASDAVTRELLMDKARQKELVLCMPVSNALALELKSIGAEVCAYGASVLESPSSRFTITFFGRDGSRVAVGRAEGNNHVIDEFSAGSHPAFYLAADLVKLARSLEAH